MPRSSASDAKKKSRPRTKKSGATRTSETTQSGINWVGMVVGLLVGLFAAFLFYLDGIPSPEKSEANEKKEVALKLPTPQTQPNTPKVKEKPKEKTKVETKNTRREHEFDFYTILPDQEVKVSAHENKNRSNPQTPPARNDKKTLPSDHNLEYYQLQVGAFSILGKADAMKAQLAFMGIESNIQTVKLPSGQTMYRVRVGPSSNKNEINRIRQQLKGQNITAFIQKM